MDQVKHCFFLFHDWLPSITEKVVLQKRGPFDKRPKKDRTVNRYVEVCAKCGKKQYYWNGGLDFV